MNSEKVVPLVTLTCVVIVAFGLPAAVVVADPGSGAKKVSLDELPQPPHEIQKLLETANVSFQTGDREHNPAGRGDTPGRGSRRLDGETKYTIHYSFNHRCRWQTRETNGKLELVITVRYREVSFDDSHSVWLRQRPDTDRFWENKLVRHELDHVKISSDPALAERFSELLRENAVLKRALEPNAVVTETLVNRLIEQHVKQLFDQISQLIEIRYRELDRVTDHGIYPLSADSPLAELLRHTAETKTGSE